MPIVAWIIAAAFAAAFAGGVVHTYNSAIADRDAARADVKTEQHNVTIAKDALRDQRVENAKLQAAAEITDKINARRGAANVTAAQIEGIINAKLGALQLSSPEVRKWATTPVPAGVLDIVREPAVKPIERPGNGQGDSRKAAGAVDITDKGAGMAGDNAQRGTAGIRPAKPATRSGVQWK